MTVLRTSPIPIDCAALRAELTRSFPDQKPEVRGLFASQDDEIAARFEAEGDPEKAKAVREALGDGIGTDNGFEVRLNGITITCMPVMAPAPGLDEVLQTTRMDREELASTLAGHDNHLLCFTKADAAHGVQATVQLVRLAVALEGQGAVGVIQTDAWQCFLVKRLREYLDPAALEEITGKLYPMVFCNILPFHGQGGSWIASKGFAVAGVPDVAMWTRNREEMQLACNFIANLFLYLKKGAKLKLGETIEMGGSGHYRIGRVTEFKEYLCGRADTIALRPV